MNHFNEFVELVRGQRWMSEEFGSILINKFAAGQSDAYDRGQKNAFSTHVCEVKPPKPTLETLSKRQIVELKEILRGKIRGKQPFPGNPVINAIKRARELTDASLKDSKFFIDKLYAQIQRRTPTGINTVTGKNVYGNK